jgi:divalent metal cation (Fe/Co/Zn/Cd) transporter
MDTVPGGPLDASMRRLLMSVSGVKTVEEVMAHRFGPYYMVNATIGVDGGISVVQGDAIATAAETAVLSKMNFVKKVYIHYHPTETK